jgi:hypothetical protein
MNGRTLLTALGAGVTTFLLVTVAVIELLDFEFSAIVALPIGILVGIVVLIGVGVSMSSLSAGGRRFVSAYAAFGLTVISLLGLRYVNVGRSVLSTDLIVGAGVAVAVVAYVALFVGSRSAS